MTATTGLRTTAEEAIAGDGTVAASFDADVAAANAASDALRAKVNGSVAVASGGADANGGEGDDGDGEGGVGGGIGGGIGGGGGAAVIVSTVQETL